MHYTLCIMNYALYIMHYELCIILKFDNQFGADSDEAPSGVVGISIAIKCFGEVESSLLE